MYGYSENTTVQLRTITGAQLRMMNVGGRELLPASTDPHDGCNNAAMYAKGRYCFESGNYETHENMYPNLFKMTVRQCYAVIGVH